MRSRSSVTAMAPEGAGLVLDSHARARGVRKHQRRKTRRYRHETAPGPAPKAPNVLRLKRAYEPTGHLDGYRILVDRLWPRGVSRKTAAIDEWMKEVAPSTELRRWFAHDPEKWREFRRRYRQELQAHEHLLRDIAALASRRRVTLVYGARDEVHNDAVVLAELIRARMKRASSRPRETRES